MNWWIKRIYSAGRRWRRGFKTRDLCERMTELEMIDLLEKQIPLLDAAGSDMTRGKEYLWVGKWLTAFEAVYIQRKKFPGVVSEEHFNALYDYFKVDLSDLDR